MQTHQPPKPRTAFKALLALASAYPCSPSFTTPSLYLFISLLQPLNTHILCAPTVLNAFDFSNPILPLGSRISHSL